ncbi:hypothetical protein BTM25_57400 [Actinomadura rubteroloni]|uniref:Uncharacterized protein n=1 Tax=Actinomadura rubteroloni TaxID=1926885 RepID=A0A2P4UBB5_9ACTN|nr:hypothetical protein [Actinomadura rubteroloni]POM22328.1 hypothetical protein BTM25_57400 [Actinomadura rubteroloni]
MPLPPPDAVWSEAAAMAVLAAAVPELSYAGFDVRPDGLRLRDTGDGWWAITRIAGGRAVLYGSGRAAFHAPPVDVLGGGPDWLPWDLLVGLLDEDSGLGFVRWWDGTSWSHAPLPEHLADSVAYVDGTTEDLYLDLADVEDPGAALEALLDAARAGTVDRAVIEALADAPDVTAALAVAERAGVGPGAERPEIPAGTGEPPGRRVPLADPAQAGGVLALAMRDAAERERPAPAPGPELDAVVEWVRAAGAVTAAYVGHERRGFAYAAASGGWLDPDLSDLLTAWREAEADPERGRWTHARVWVADDAVTVERVYDHLPAWWEQDHLPEAQVEALRAEVARRAPGWRPSWAALLDEDLLRTGVPPELCWRPRTTPDAASLLRSGALRTAPREVWEAVRSAVVALARADAADLAALVAAEPAGPRPDGERTRWLWLRMLADAGAVLPAAWFATVGARCPEPALRRLLERAALAPGVPSADVPRDVARTAEPEPGRDPGWNTATDFAAFRLDGEGSRKVFSLRLGQFLRDIGTYANVDYTTVLDRIRTAQDPIPALLRARIDAARERAARGGLPALDDGLAELAPAACAGLPEAADGLTVTDPVDALAAALRTGLPAELTFPFGRPVPVRASHPVMVVQHGDRLTVTDDYLGRARVYGPDGELLAEPVPVPPLFPDRRPPARYDGPLLWHDGTALRTSTYDRTAGAWRTLRIDGVTDDRDALLTRDPDTADLGPAPAATAEVTFPGADRPTTVRAGDGRLTLHAPDGTATARVPFGIVQAVARDGSPVPPPGWWPHLRPVDPAGSAVLRRIGRAAARELAEAALIGPVEAARRLDALLPEITDPGLRTAVLDQAALAARCLHRIAALGLPGVPDLLAPAPGPPVRRFTGIVAGGRALANVLERAMQRPPGQVHVTDLPDLDRRPLPFLRLGALALGVVWPWVTPYARSRDLDELSAWAATPLGDGTGRWSEVRLTGPGDGHGGEVWRLPDSALVILRGDRPATALRYTPDGEFTDTVPPGWEWNARLRHGWGSPDAVAALGRLLAERGPLPPDPAWALDLADRAGISRADAAHACFGEPGDVPPEIAGTGRPALSTGVRTRLRELMMPDDPAVLWTEGPDVARAAAWFAARG